MSIIEPSTTPWPENEMEQYRWLDELLVNQLRTEKEFNSAWQAYKYMLKGKMYAYIGIHEPSGRPIITLKLPPEYSSALRGEHDDVIPGYYMNKLHWSTIFLDGTVPHETLKTMTDLAYETVLSSLSKKARQEVLG